MSKIFFTKFAQAGSRTPIDVPSQPDGKISYEEGWPIGYELPQGDPGYKPIDRAEMNGLVFELTDAIGELQMFGFAAWQPGTWPKGARVRHLGELYVSTAQTTEAPPHSDWEISTGASFLESKTFQVGPTGDFATITEALSTLSRVSPLYKAEAITCELKLQPGFTMAEQIIVGPGVDLSWVTITAEGDVSVSEAGEKALGYGLGAFPIFWASGGHMPKIGARFKNNSGEQLVAFAATGHGSVIDVTEDGGAEDCIVALLAFDGGRINAPQAKCAKNYNGIFTSGGEIWAPGVDLSKSLDKALNASDGARVWIPKDENGQPADLSKSAGEAMEIEDGAVVIADGANCSDAGSDAIIVDGAKVSLKDANIQNANGRSIKAENGAVVIADGVTIDGSDAPCVTVRSGSRASINDAKITANTQGGGMGEISAVDVADSDLSGINSEVTFVGGFPVSFLRSKGNLTGGKFVADLGESSAVRAHWGSVVVVNEAELSQADNGGFALESYGSEVSARNANASGTRARVRLLFGGTVRAQGSNLTYSETPNQISSHGIFFKDE